MGVASTAKAPVSGAGDAAAEGVAAAEALALGVGDALEGPQPASRRMAATTGATTFKPTVFWTEPAPFVRGLPEYGRRSPRPPSTS